MFTGALNTCFDPEKRVHYLYIVGISQEHSETINIHSPASGKRQAIFHGSAKVFINYLSSFVAKKQKTY